MLLQIFHINYQQTISCIQDKLLNKCYIEFVYNGVSNCRRDNAIAEYSH